MKFGTQSLLFRESGCSQETSVPKKVLPLKELLFWRTACFEKYLFWVTTYSEEVAPPKWQLCWIVLILKKQLIIKSICYQEVVTRKLFKATRCSEKVIFSKKSGFIWLLSFQYSWCCSEVVIRKKSLIQVAALISILSMLPWKCSSFDQRSVSGRLVIWNTM